MKYLLLVAVLLMSSCGPKWHLRQSKKHELKAIAMGAVASEDTVWVDRAVYVKETALDSVLIPVVGDTIYLEKERLLMKVVQLPGDSIYIFGHCKPDTVKISVPVTITKVLKVPEKGLRWFHLIGIGFALGIVAVILLRR